MGAPFLLNAGVSDMKFNHVLCCAFVSLSMACSANPRPDSQVNGDAVADGDSSLPPDYVPCTGAWREVERVEFSVSRTGSYAGRAMFHDGSLWTSIERSDNTGTGSYEPVLVRATGWGSSPSATVIPREQLSFARDRTRFVEGRDGAAFAHFVSLYALPSLAAVNLGVSSAIPSALVLRPQETLVLESSPMFTPRIKRYRAIPVDSMGTAEVLGTVELPTLPSSEARMFGSIRNSAVFIAAPSSRGADRWAIHTLDANLRLVGAPLELEPALSWWNWVDGEFLHVERDGLWVVTTVAAPGGEQRFTVLRLANDASVRTVVSRPATELAMFQHRQIAVRGDQLALTRARMIGNEQYEGQLDVYDASTGALLQTISDAHGVAFSNDSLFVVGAPLMGAPGTVRRYVCR